MEGGTGGEGAPPVAGRAASRQSPFGFHGFPRSVATESETVESIGRKGGAVRPFQTTKSDEHDLFYLRTEGR